MWRTFRHGGRRRREKHKRVGGYGLYDKLIQIYRRLVADHIASGLDAGADGHFGSFDVDQALESSVSGLRVWQVFSFQDELAGNSTGHQIVFVGRTSQTRAITGSMGHQMRRILSFNQHNIKISLIWVEKKQHFLPILVPQYQFAKKKFFKKQNRSFSHDK